MLLSSELMPYLHSSVFSVLQGRDWTFVPLLSVRWAQCLSTVCSVGVATVVLVIVVVVVMCAFVCVCACARARSSMYVHSCVCEYMCVQTRHRY